MPFTGRSRLLNHAQPSGFENSVQIPNTTFGEAQQIPAKICNYLFPNHTESSLTPLNVSNLTAAEQARIPQLLVSENNISTTFHYTNRRHYIAMLVQYENHNLTAFLKTFSHYGTSTYAYPDYIAIPNTVAINEQIFNGAPSNTTIGFIKSLVNHNIFQLANAQQGNIRGLVALPCIGNTTYTSTITTPPSIVSTSASTEAATFNTSSLAPSSTNSFQGNRKIETSMPIYTLQAITGSSRLTQEIPSTPQPIPLESTAAQIFTQPIIYSTYVNQSNTTIDFTPTSNLENNISDVANESIPAWTVPITVVSTVVVLGLGAGTIIAIIKRRTIIGLFKSKEAQIHPNKANSTTVATVANHHNL